MSVNVCNNSFFLKKVTLKFSQLTYVVVVCEYSFSQIKINENVQVCVCARARVRVHLSTVLV